MEEKNKAKEVKMGITSNKGDAPKKLSYEQLNDACNQLWQQNKQLIQENKELVNAVTSKRIDCLFKIVENSKAFTSEFVTDCAKEIEDAIRVTQNNKN